MAKKLLCICQLVTPVLRTTVLARAQTNDSPATSAINNP
jgi:hypothetical protein